MLNEAKRFYPVLMLTIAVLMCAVHLAAQFDGGSGTEEDPWQISRPYHLDEIRQYTGRQHSDKYYIQTADIDLGVPPWNRGQGWVPVGDSVNNSFQGQYDGNGFAIYNLYISRTASFQALFGYVADAKINNLSIKGANVSGLCCVGIIVGRMERNTVISNSYVVGNVNGDLLAGGLVGSNWFSIIRNSCYSYEGTLINRRNILTLGAVTDDMFNAWLGNNLSLDIDDYLIMADGKYEINNVSDLRKLLYFGQFGQYSFTLQNDIDLAGETNFYLPYFAGSFYGNENTINNLFVNLPAFSRIGFFGMTYRATVKDLAITNINLAGYSFIGGLVGHNFTSSHIENCFTTGRLRGLHPTDTRIGGLVGSNRDGSSINMSYSTAEVTARRRVGGLVGENRQNSTITDCYARGDAIGDHYVGGLIGFHREHCTVSNSYSTGGATGSWFVGGLIGNNYTSTAINSYWDAQTSGVMISRGGFLRNTAQMTYVSDNNTYVDWNFINIWADDIDYDINDGYPYFGWQNAFFMPKPVVHIIINDQQQPFLWWNQIEGANSYKIYTSTDPYLPFRLWRMTNIIPDTEYIDTNPMGPFRFYRVIASSELPRRRR